MKKTVSWFSAGASSAAATLLRIKDVDEIYYIHIDDQHPDSLRFVHDCEQLYGKTITILQSPYKSVEAASLGAGGRGYVNGPSGAACTKILKKQVRLKWEYEQPVGTEITYIWGMDSDEKDRADRLVETMPQFKHVFPLIDYNLTKAQAHQILKANSINRPAMYDLGYTNNNCVGCVKGGMGYWIKIREDFPEVFAARANMERQIGATCLKGVYLDELDPTRGRQEPMVMDDCGILCEALYKEIQ